MKLAFAIAAATFALIGNNVHSEENPYRGNNMLSGCKASISKEISWDDETKIKYGICIATVRTIMLGDNTRYFCVPQGADLNQALKVAIEFMENNPADLHRDITALVTFALAEAWPCEN